MDGEKKFKNIIRKYPISSVAGLLYDVCMMYLKSINQCMYGLSRKGLEEEEGKEEKHMYKKHKHIGVKTDMGGERGG